MSAPLNLSELHVGMKLPELHKNIVQEDINLYAKASRDFNPIHIDEEFARKTPLGGTVAHGMLILAYMSQLMTVNFAKNWLTGGSLNVRFKAPARPGDVIIVSGTIEKIQDELMQVTVSCDVLCANQKGEAVITGQAIVRIKKDENLS
jgi:3-hydroxybutyryl-CoA dehydratase